jgi:hypothetical protein
LQLTVEDAKTFFSVAAFAVSVVSIYFTRVNWLQSNRPIVTAFVIEHEPDGEASAFNLVIANTGNRPAVQVRMHATEREIRALLEDNVSVKYYEMIASNFSKDSEIPLLRNGEELSTSFGAYLGNSSTGAWLKYGAETEIVIAYQDLDGRRYRSRQPVKIYARAGFGGGVWNERK